MEEMKEMKEELTREPEISRCAGVLEQEIQLLSRIADLQTEARQAVTRREWEGFEGLFSQLDEAGEEFARLDEERGRHFAGIARRLGVKGDERAAFYTLAARLPPPARRELTGLYRRLKTDALRVRIAGDSLATYLAEAKAAVSGFLTAAFPERAPKVYTQRGLKPAADMRGIVVNQRL